MWFRRGKFRGTLGRKATPVQHPVEKTRPSPFPSEACETEYNKLMALEESHQLPRGLTGEELTTYLDDLEQRLYG